MSGTYSPQFILEIVRISIMESNKLITRSLAVRSSNDSQSESFLYISAAAFIIEDKAFLF